MSIRQDREPVRLAETLAELVAQLLAAETDPLPLRYIYWRLGYAAAELAYADDYERGFADGCMSVKRAQHDAHGLVEFEGRRWELRGEKRTRQTFGRPHSGDRKGNGAA